MHSNEWLYSTLQYLHHSCITYLYSIFMCFKNLFTIFQIWILRILFHYPRFAITSTYNSKKKKKKSAGEKAAASWILRLPMKEPLATVVEITRPFSAPINYIRRRCAPLCRLRLADRGDKRAATITLKQHLISLSGRPDESSQPATLSIHSITPPFNRPTTTLFA